VYENSYNSYIDVPVMAHFIFGSRQLQGFINAGMYAGYWMSGRVKGVSPNTPAIITPQTGSVEVTKPVVVLTDIWTTSMAELTVMAVHGLPNGNGHTVVETTWRAKGPITDNEILNGGQFTVAGFVYVYTSSSMFKYIDENIYEGNGFPPDYIVPFNLNAFQTTGDTLLEKALSLMP
jgi:carboxyl-terminal processing protease